MANDHLLFRKREERFTGIVQTLLDMLLVTSGDIGTTLINGISSGHYRSYESRIYAWVLELSLCASKRLGTRSIISSIEFQSDFSMLKGCQTWI